MGDYDPGAVLTRLNRHIKEVLAQDAGSEGQGPGRTSDDGMDAACFLLEPATRVLRFAGSRMPLVVLDAATGALETLDEERTGIGYVGTPDEQVWHLPEINTEPAYRGGVTWA